MGKDRNQRIEADAYPFIKETIKRKPVDKRLLFHRMAGMVGGGVLFGACASAAFAVTYPTLAERINANVKDAEDVKLSTPTPEVSRPEVVRETDIPSTEKSDSSSLLGSYENIYTEALQIAEEPRKALVTVSSMSGDSDLLDHSLLSNGDAEGIIFLENDSDYYILTDSAELGIADTLQITFFDESICSGYLCQTDAETGLSVIRVSADEMKEETKETISVATLDNSSSLEQLKSVIAIGNPAGDHDAVMYGMVTSVNGRLSVADREYSVLATDIHGIDSSEGVLINTRGDVVGLIWSDGDNTDGVIRALAISQLRPLIQRLSNGNVSRYLGVRGITVTPAKSNVLNMPMGVYVENVDNDSPAMAAGIQNGDVIKSLDGEVVTSMRSYTDILQNLPVGQKVKIVLARKNADEKYVDMDFQVTIEER